MIDSGRLLQPSRKSDTVGLRPEALLQSSPSFYDSCHPLLDSHNRSRGCNVLGRLSRCSNPLFLSSSPSQLKITLLIHIKEEKLTAIHSCSSLSHGCFRKASVLFFEGFLLHSQVNMAQKGSSKGRVVEQLNKNDKRGSLGKPKDYTSHGVTDNDILLLPGSDFQVMAALTVLALAVRLFRIYQPSSVVFDEVQSVNAFLTRPILASYD